MMISSQHKKIISLALIFFISVISHDFVLADNRLQEGEQLAKDMLNKSVINSVTSSSGHSTLANLGISANTVGSPSSDQRNDMGIAGQSMSQFDFLIKPACQNMQSLLGLGGIKMTITCQSSINSEVNAQVCLPQESKNKCEMTTIVIPTDGKTVFKNGYDWQGICDSTGKCHGSMAQSGSVTGNADNLVNQGQKAQVNNEAYHAIYDSYASKEGYNRTQAYMRSFEANGQNKWLPECMQHADGFIKDGIYYSCDGSQQGDLYNSCKTVKECTKYEYKTVIEEINKVCEITSSSTNLTCTRSPQVTIQTRDTTYPNCKNLIITQGAGTHCPSGYTEELYSDMIIKVTWDDIRLCTKIVSPSDSPNCYTGAYYIATSVNPFFGNGQGFLPKCLHGRLQLNHVYRGNVFITVINNNTGKTIVDHSSQGEGSVIDLPFSYTEDQTFKFYISGKGTQTGVLTMLVDHHGQYKTSSVTITQSCPTS